MNASTALKRCPVSITARVVGQNASGWAARNSPTAAVRSATQGPA